VDEEHDKQVVVMSSRVVARVHIPPQQVFELMKALERQLSAWEAETGNKPKDPDADLPPSEQAP
jgi:hypothetical protein